jgi:hypothetical protein
MNTLKDSKKKFEEEFGDNDFDFEEYADIESVWNFIESTVRQALKETEPVPKRINHSNRVKQSWENGPKFNKHERLAFKRGWNTCTAKYWIDKKQKIKEYLGEVK